MPVGRENLDRRDRLREPFHALEPPLAVADALHRTCQLEDGFARQDLAGPRERAEAGGEVERPAPISVGHRHGFARIEPDTDAARQLRLGDALLDPDRRAQRLPRGIEDDEGLVAAQFDQPAFAFLDHLLDDVREGRSELGRGLVSMLGRVARVAAYVRDQERPHAGNRPAGRAGDLRHLHGERLAGFGNQLATGRETVVRCLGERLLDDRVNRVGKIGAKAGHERRRLLQVREDDLELAVALERRGARQALVEHAAERVDVRARVDRSTLDLLWSDVRDRPDERVPGQARHRRRVSREAEVAEVGVLGLARADQDVRRLDVAMDEAEPVGHVERISHLAEQAQRPLVADGLGRVDQLAQVVALDVLHGEEENIVLLARAVDRDDVRMLETRRQLRLEEETPPEAIVPCEVASDDLDRGLAMQMRVLGEIDRTHRTVTEQPLHAEAA